MRAPKTCEKWAYIAREIPKSEYFFWPKVTLKKRQRMVLWPSAKSMFPYKNQFDRHWLQKIVKKKKKKEQGKNQLNISLLIYVFVLTNKSIKTNL